MKFFEFRIDEMHCRSNDEAFPKISQAELCPQRIRQRWF